jgi:hypothetical protein
MDEIESISRCAYYNILVFIINLLGQNIHQFQAMTQAGAQAEQVEKKMAWILYACAVRSALLSIYLLHRLF